MIQSGHTPLVSIILPTYNRAEFIMEAISSVLFQTWTAWELLVVDDQSTDETPQRVASIADSRIRYIRTEKRLWVTASRNLGLEKSRGEFIAFLDSDDLWASDKLQKQLEAFALYPDAGLALTGGYNFIKRNEPVEYFYKKREGLFYGSLFIPFFKGEVSITTPSLIFKRTCLRDVRFFDDRKSFADADFVIQLSQRYPGIVLYEPLFYRRLHETNLSKQHWEKGYEEGIELIRKYRRDLPAAIAKQRLFQMYINSGEKYLSFKQGTKAFLLFIKAWKMKPGNWTATKKILKSLVSFLK